MTRGSIVLAVALVSLTVPPAAAERDDLSLKSLVNAASKYVVRYEKEFAFLLAEESYLQHRLKGTTTLERRTLKSEFFLTFLPGDEEWVAVRDVKTVDDEPVATGDDLRTMLATKAEFRGLIAQVVNRNARYNIGVTRNFNEPTLPLLLLEAKRVNDVKFERGAVVKDGDATLVTLTFAERGRPTLVRGPDGSMPATGEFVIEAGTGTIRRTRFDLDRAGVKVRLATTYARDSRLNLWLPDTFSERYDTPATQEIVVCEAVYSNYRRFEVNARIR
ncbi:MAG TPA: hypothetical protein VFV78_03650 [Vicinamibacterales bacterium]|nr:hypothetical protein [Vicinamibacterales bacterium]